MFFSMYEALFEYDYTNNTQSISLALSANNTIKGSYIGNGTWSTASNPFSSSSDSMPLWEIIAASVGGFLLLVIIGITIYCCCCRKKGDDVSESAKNEILYSP